MADDELNEETALSKLVPCQLCGGGETRVRAQHTPPRMSGSTALIGVYIHHQCQGLTKAAQRRSIEVHGRDYEDAIAAWNTRAAPAPSEPIIEKLKVAEHALLIARHRLAAEASGDYTTTADDGLSAVRAAIAALRAANKGENNG